MSQHCRRIVLEEYSLDVQAKQYERLYESLLAQRPVSAASTESLVQPAAPETGTSAAAAR